MIQQRLAVYVLLILLVLTKMFSTSDEEEEEEQDIDVSTLECEEWCPGESRVVYSDFPKIAFGLETPTQKKCVSKTEFMTWAKELGVSFTHIDRLKNIYDDHVEKYKGDKVCLCEAGSRGAKCEMKCSKLRKNQVVGPSRNFFADKQHLWTYGPLCLGLCSPFCAYGRCNVYTGQCIDLGEGTDRCRLSGTGPLCLPGDEEESESDDDLEFSAERCSHNCKYTIGPLEEVGVQTKLTQSKIKLNFASLLEDYPSFRKSWTKTKDFYDVKTRNEMGTCVKQKAFIRWFRKLAVHMHVGNTKYSNLLAQILASKRESEEEDELSAFLINDVGYIGQEVFQSLYHEKDKKICMCLPGSAGNTCSEKCEPRTLGGQLRYFYGPMCLGLCSPYCSTSNVQCNPYTGECTDGGCQEGWLGPRCDKRVEKPKEEESESEEEAEEVAKTAGNFLMAGQATSADEKQALSSLLRRRSSSLKKRTSRFFAASLVLIFQSSIKLAADAGYKKKNKVDVTILSIGPPGAADTATQQKAGQAPLAEEESSQVEDSESDTEDTRKRRGRQAPAQSGLQINFEATFFSEPAQDQPDIESQMSDAIKDNVDKLKINELPGFAMDPDSVQLSNVELLTLKDETSSSFSPTSQVAIALAGVGLVAVALMAALRNARSKTHDKNRSRAKNEEDKAQKHAAKSRKKSAAAKPSRKNAGERTDKSQSRVGKSKSRHDKKSTVKVVSLVGESQS